MDCILPALYATDLNGWLAWVALHLLNSKRSLKFSLKILLFMQRTPNIIHEDR